MGKLEPDLRQKTLEERRVKRPKCEDIGFKHKWKDTTPQWVYATYPPQYPSKQRQCENCGKQQTEKLVQREVREWQDD
jgi:hypothetical protein